MRKFLILMMLLTLGTTASMAQIQRNSAVRTTKRVSSINKNAKKIRPIKGGRNVKPTRILLKPGQEGKNTKPTLILLKPGQEGKSAPNIKTPTQTKPTLILLKPGQEGKTNNQILKNGAGMPDDPTQGGDPDGIIKGVRDNVIRR